MGSYLSEQRDPTASTYDADETFPQIEQWENEQERYRRVERGAIFDVYLRRGLPAY